MFLSHQAIEDCLAKKLIIIGPAFDAKNLRPAGIRLHLGDTLLIPEPDQTVDLTEPTELRYKKIDLNKTVFYLKPDEFILGSTYETVQTAPNILALLDGRSTIARLGLTTHVTAAVIDGTFAAPHTPTLEIKNVGNFTIRLKPGDPIAMMLFAELKDPVTQNLQSQYHATLQQVAPPNLTFKTGRDS